MRAEQLRQIKIHYGQRLTLNGTTYELVPDKDCRTCHGTGTFTRYPRPGAAPRLAACGCLRRKKVKA